MRVIPVIHCREVKKSLAFYTGVLDFEKKYPEESDEEWVIEMAIPFESLGLEGRPGERLGLSMHRCDTTKTGERVCGAWGEGERKGVIILTP